MMLKKVFISFKTNIRRLLEALKLVNTESENPAPVTSETYEQYYLLSILIKKALDNLDKDKLKSLYIVEAGIGKGNTFLFLSLIAEKLNTKIIGFDSFCGFPEIKNPLDRRIGKKKLKKGQWNVSSKNSIKNKLRNSCIGEDFIVNNVELVEGYFEDSLKNFDKKKKIFFLHLDVDLYSSYKTCLENLWENLIEGGIVVFDEYNDSKWPDAKVAIDKFFTSKNRKVEVESLFQRGYLIK